VGTCLIPPPARRGNACHAVPYGTDLLGIPFQALRAWLRSIQSLRDAAPGPASASLLFPANRFLWISDVFPNFLTHKTSEKNVFLGYRG